jgi:hypothetical protein
MPTHLVLLDLAILISDVTAHHFISFCNLPLPGYEHSPHNSVLKYPQFIFPLRMRDEVPNAYEKGLTVTSVISAN